ncbi:MAG: SCO family protein [Blastocatellia bacterium]|nr:SCO family protein [Blastocatellia bacterium]MCS7157939.1 SCO family protein [Blastocatellia bacterium]MCX7752446.1 SCO family protein [Blastocatellia bacterium]MDW8167439.1 SCO family protein [Acidobacteriota bacterium]MDW8257383.1 SCO family protein [Acidobacteriota bacterium]
MRIQGTCVRAISWASLGLVLAVSFGLLVVREGRGQNVSSEQPAPILQNVGIDQKLDAQIPLELVFRDEQGRAVSLREYFGEKPVILSLVYYECPMLCTLILNGLLRSLRALPLTVGKEFTVVTVSFDPREGPELAAAKKRTYVQSYGRPEAEAGWHFLTGEQESIRRLTEAVGFRYAFDPQTGQFAHASGIMVLTPQGRVARYFYGIEYAPRDLRLGLIEAAQGKIGSPVDQILLYCYHYDPKTGRYSLLIMNVLRLAGIATVLVLGGFIFVMFRRDRRKKRMVG